MRKHKLVTIVVSVVAVGVMGALLSMRNQSNRDRTAESLGLGLRTPTPSLSPRPGTIALTDVQELLKPISASTATTQFRTLEGGLQVQDALVGNGSEAIDGAVLTVHYTGRLEDGAVFDSSVKRQEPFTFTLGAGNVIRGWDLGLTGMKVGGKRLLIIPPELAYGDREVGGVIPARATLLFEVDLLDVEMR
jgi:FKBP-type peptidyl-prolyl cis-trans isomerase FkpA